MFLADFSKMPNEKERKSMLGTAKNILIGKNLPGFLTRVGAVGAIGGAIYGGNKTRQKLKNISPIQQEYYIKDAVYKKRKAIQDGLNTAGKVGAGVAGTVGIGALAKNQYDKRTRKWWEVL